MFTVSEDFTIDDRHGIIPQINKFQSDIELYCDFPSILRHYPERILWQTKKGWK